MYMCKVPYHTKIFNNHDNTKYLKKIGYEKTNTRQSRCIYYCLFRNTFRKKEIQFCFSTPPSFDKILIGINKCIFYTRLELKGMSRVIC